MTDAVGSVRSDSRFLLHNLVFRRDRAEWIAGRYESRRFVALPPEGKAALDLLGAGYSVADTTDRLIESEGVVLDVRSFAQSLIELGFVAEVDGRPVPGAAPAPATFPRIRSRHVRFALNPVLPMLFGCLLVAAVAALVVRPGLRPDFRDLLWSPAGSAVLAVTFIGGWSLVFLHELAHFVVARATGVYARIQLGTRLQFLVAETDISGIELAPRRHRMTAYLAGMATNLTVASIAILCLAATAEDTAGHRFLAATVVIALLPLPFQFMVFMRTDIYFVLQDLTGCRDLYGDGRAYARYCGRAVRNKIFRRSGSVGEPGREVDADPSCALPAHERRAVRIYSVVLVAGTAACLAVMAFIMLPTDLTLIARAVTRLGPAETAATSIDSAVVLLVLGTVHTVWAVTWWRRRTAGRAR